VTLPADLELRAPAPGDERAIAALVAACDETFRSWAPPGWEPPPPGTELDRWRGRITDGSWWTRIALEPGGRVVGLVCFTQALTWVQEDARAGEPIPQRAHVSAVFTHPDRWREGIAAAMLAAAEAQMRAEGYREVQLWTPRGAPARRFYEAAGWRHDGREQWLAELALPIVAYVKPL
jgi:GNAT superfamily N-acetyltransferase